MAFKIWNTEIIAHSLYIKRSYSNRLSGSLVLHSIALLLKSGCSLATAVQLTSDNTSINRTMRRSLKLQCQRITNGGRLSDYIKRYRGIYSVTVASIVREAENSDMLIDGLFRASHVLKRDIDRKITRMEVTMYMFQVIMVLLTINEFMRYAVMPTFDDIAASVQMTYPPLLKLCSITCDLLNHLATVGVLIFILSLLLFFVRRFINKIPFLPVSRGGNYLAIATALNAAGDALNCGFSLNDGLRIAGRSTGFSRLEKRFVQMAHAITMGQSPEIALSDTGLLSPDIAAMFSSRGISPDTFHQVAAFLESQGQILVKRRFTHLIFWFYLITGFLVGALVGSIYLFHIYLVQFVSQGVIV